MTTTVADLAARIHAAVRGDGGRTIRGMAVPGDEAPDVLVYVEKPGVRFAAEGVKPGNYLVPAAWTPPEAAEATWLLAADPRASFRAALDALNPWRVVSRRRRLSDVPAGADVHADADLGPGVILMEGAKVEAGAVLMGNNYVGENALVGRDAVLHPGVVLEAGCSVGARTVIHANTVVGSDGFGFDRTPAGAAKVPQIGAVAIGEDCEIGSNVSVDRAAIGLTVIGDRVKIDNLCQIAHNVRIESDALIVAGAMIGGSSVIGRGAVLAGSVSLGDHVVLGPGALLAGLSGVHPGKRVPAGEAWAGFPAGPVRDQLRMTAALKKLPDVIKAVQKLQAGGTP